MINCSYLRVYQPLSAFSEAERERWASSMDGRAEAHDEARRRWLVSASLEGADGTVVDGVFVREVNGEPLMCPWRTRLRMLAGMLAFREAIPEEVAEAFVPQDEARRAASELAELQRDEDLRSNILHANWHVPLRWFAAFDAGERVLVEDEGGVRVRYETTLVEARDRLDRALRILDESWAEDSVTEAVRELRTWIELFPGDGLLELDYGSVARMFRDDDLVEDQSTSEVWYCLDALDAGDLQGALQTFEELTTRWGRARVREVAN